MGSVRTAPVNEAVNLLSRIAPTELARLQADLPEIAEELRPGIMAGEEDLGDDAKSAIALAKAKAMLIALHEARQLCEAAIPEASARLERGGSFRFYCQIVTTVASGSVLGALGLSAAWAAGASGFLALLASIGSLCADRVERVIDPNQGNLSAIYLQLVDSRYKAGALHDALRIHVEFGHVGPELDKVVTEGNALCEYVNKSVYQVVMAHRRNVQLLAGTTVTTLPSGANEQNSSI